MKNIPYWQDMPYTARPALDGDTEADVVVVGGGITGISTAYHCTKAGFKTILIEKDVIGFGSGGRNGGMVTEGLEIDYYQIIEHVGHEKARELWNNTVSAKRLIVSLIKENNIDCDYEEPGSLYVSVDESENIKLEKEFSVRQNDGFACELIEKGEQLSQSPFVKTLYNQTDGLLHPIKFIRGLARCAEKQGLRIYDNTPALSYDAHTVTTPHGIIRADKVIIALESANRELPADATLYRSQAVVTEPLSDDVLARLDWKKGGMLWPTGEDYIALRLIGKRFFWCKNLSLNPTEKELEENREWQINKIISFFPSLTKDDLIVSHVWTGLMVSASDYHSHIRNTNGYYEIFGHSGLGLTHGILTGKLISEHFLGADIPEVYR